MLNDLIDASGRSSDFFVGVSLVVFMVVALLVVVFRVLRILRAASRQPRRQPNLRPLRRSRQSVAKPGEEAAKEGE